MSMCVSRMKLSHMVAKKECYLCEEKIGQRQSAVLKRGCPVMLWAHLYCFLVNEGHYKDKKKLQEIEAKRGELT